MGSWFDTGLSVNTMCGLIQVRGLISVCYVLLVHGSIRVHYLKLVPSLIWVLGG